MTVYETIGRNQTAALSALHHSNEALLDVMKAFLTRSSFPMVMRERRHGDGLPAPKETIEQWFGFFDGVLKEEKEFLLSVVGLLPEYTEKPSVVKTSAKAA